MTPGAQPCIHAEPHAGGERHTFEPEGIWPTAARCRLCKKTISEILGEYRRLLDEIDKARKTLHNTVNPGPKEEAMKAILDALARFGGLP